jgi:NAD(P)-dependent dehydrogenase (short-subunit alcohol dehydrogenase family)
VWGASMDLRVLVRSRVIRLRGPGSEPNFYLAVRLDVTKRATLEEAFVSVERSLGGTDILVNNAGAAAAISGGVLNQAVLDRTPTRRWAKADEVAGAAVFLASQAAGFVTGVMLPVDGRYAIF